LGNLSILKLKNWVHDDKTASNLSIENLLAHLVLPNRIAVFEEQKESGNDYGFYQLKLETG